MRLVGSHGSLLHIMYRHGAHLRAGCHTKTAILEGRNRSDNIAARWHQGAGFTPERAGPVSGPADPLGVDTAKWTEAWGCWGVDQQSAAYVSTASTTIRSLRRKNQYVRYSRMDIATFPPRVSSFGDDPDCRHLILSTGRSECEGRRATLCGVSCKLFNINMLQE